ncbi:MAG: DUF4157 domain-containing protein [Cyanobacteria bacterium P01_F01_bin.86]
MPVTNQPQQATVEDILQRKYQHHVSKSHWLQRQATQETGQTGVPLIVSQVLQSEGYPLDSANRAFMEQRFQHDFSRVRIHTDPDAVASAQALNALAYTSSNHIVLGHQYSPHTARGKHILAHELTHVVQQQPGLGSARQTVRSASAASENEAETVARRLVRQQPIPQIQQKVELNHIHRLEGRDETSAGSSSTASGSATTPPPTSQTVQIDVLAADNPDDFLVRGAAEALGVDIRVRSMSDMVGQVERLASSNCVSRLTIFNHGNPSLQTVAGGDSAKDKGAAADRVPLSGFSLNWLLSDANQSSLNRLRNSFCCQADMMWLGCVTSGVWASGGSPTAEEIREEPERYSGYRTEFYQSVEDALEHGAVDIRYLGSVNAQTWSDATCTTITAANDIVHWRTSRTPITRYVGHGGQSIEFDPQPDANCTCDPETGRVAGTAPGRADLRQRAIALREEMLRPAYERVRDTVGQEPSLAPETEAFRAEREAFERQQQVFFEQIGASIREAVLQRSGFAEGTQPTTPEEALQVVQFWGLTIEDLESRLPQVAASLSGRSTGSHTASSFAQRQRQLENALTPRGRETFMEMLLSVQQEPFWQSYFENHEIYIFPDLSGVNRYRGYVERGTAQTTSGQTYPVYVIHISRSLLNSGQREEAAATLVHELSHTIYEPSTLGVALRPFLQDLATLLVEHPQIAALRSGAADAEQARQQQISRLRQILYEATGYAEEEIFVHLQQLTHMPSEVEVNTSEGPQSIRGSDYILEIVANYVSQLRRIGLPNRMLAGIVGAIRRRVVITYDQRIAATPAGSRQRQILEANKEIALLTLRIALQTD